MVEIKVERINELINRMSLAITAHTCGIHHPHDYRACVKEKYSDTRRQVTEVVWARKADDPEGLKDLMKKMGVDL